MKNKSENSKFISGTLWLGLSAIVLKVIGVIYKIPLSYYLGDEGMGYFNSAYTVYTFFYILGSAGIPKAIALLTSRATDEKREYEIYSTGIKAFFALGIILTAVLLGFSKPLSVFIGSERSYYSIIGIAPSVMFVCAIGVMRGYLNGKMRFEKIAVSELIGALSKLVLGLIFAYMGIRASLPLEIISSLAILGITLGSFFSFLYLAKNIKRQGARSPYDLRIIREILKISLPLTLSASINGIAGLVDLTMILRGLTSIGYTDGVATVLYGNYSTLAIPMFSMLVALVTPVSVSVLPLLSKSHSLGNNEEFYNHLRTFSDVMSLIAIPSFFVFLFFSEECLVLLFEESSAVLGAPMLTVLSPSVLFFSVLLLVNTSLEAMGEIKIPVISISIGALAKLLIGVVLIRNEIIGIFAAPIGTVASYAISLLISYLLSLKTGSIPYRPTRKSLGFAVMGILSLIFTLVLKKSLNLYVSRRLSSLLILSFYGLVYIGLVVILYRKQIEKLKKTGILHKKSE